MSKQKFTVMIECEVEADDLNEAEDMVRNDLRQGNLGQEIYQVVEADGEDNDGQRVWYREGKEQDPFFPLDPSLKP